MAMIRSSPRADPTPERFDFYPPRHQLPLRVDEPPALLDEFAPGVSLGARDGELGLKLGVNRLVVEDNGVSVLVWLASGIDERMDRSGHLAGHDRLLGRDPSWGLAVTMAAKNGSGWLMMGKRQP